MTADTRARVMAHVRARFPPELLNRFDEMAIYNPLSKEHMTEVRLPISLTLSPFSLPPSFHTGGGGVGTSRCSRSRCGRT